MIISMPVRLEYCNPTFLFCSSQYSLDKHYLMSTMFHKLCLMLETLPGKEDMVPDPRMSIPGSQRHSSMSSGQ